LKPQIVCAAHADCFPSAPGELLVGIMTAEEGLADDMRDLLA
jgi:hypothetical protein